MKRLVFIPLLVVLFVCFHINRAVSQDTTPNSDEKQLFTLADCVATALDSNPQILYSQADILAKEFSLDSRRKDLYPSLFFQYGYTKTPDAHALYGMIEDYYNYSFSVEQPIYRGRSLVTGVELGKLDLERSKSAMTQTRNDIILAVHEAYYNLLKTRKFAEVAKQSVDERQAHLKDARAFFKAGLIPKNDMLQSEVQLANAEIDLIRAKNLSSMAQARLNTLLRQPVDMEIQVEDILKYEPSEISWEQAIDQAQNHRPELRQSDIAIDQADKNIILTRAPYLPSVSLSANYLKQGDEPTADDYPSGPNDVKTIMATLQWRFWAWGQGKDEVAVAEYNLKKARENKSELLDTIVLQVRKAYLDIKESQYNIGVTEKAIEQAEEDYRINQSRYQAQLSTTTDVIDAQTRLSIARINYFNALYSYRIALMQFAWATGTLSL